MANDHVDSSGVRLPWAGRPIRIEEVEESLTSLWSMSADNMRIGRYLNVRASVLNLAVCVPDIETARFVDSTLRTFSSPHLARVTILILDTNQEGPDILQAWATLRSFSVSSDLRRHNFEQITILTSGAATRAAATFLQHVLKPHLPVYLLWLGDPPDKLESLFKRLVDISNRVIVDSTSFFEPERDIQGLAALLEQHPDCALSDMNWGRITPWRQLITQFFDGAEYRGYLQGITQIEIEHAAAPLAIPVRTAQGEVSLNPTHALLLAGWLKTTLGWNYLPNAPQNEHDASSGTYTWQMAAPGGRTKRVLIQIRPHVQTDARPGSLTLVRLKGNVGSQSATFTIKRDSDPDYALTWVELPQQRLPIRTVNLEAMHRERELLHDELEITTHDLLFEQTLREVAALLGDGEAAVLATNS